MVAAVHPDSAFIVVAPWWNLLVEAIRDFLPFQDTDQANIRSADAAVDDVLAALRGLCSTAAADAASWGFRAASDFAGRVEEVSRITEYLQLVAAAALDRTRKQAAADAAAKGMVSGWTTGWRDTTAGSDAGSEGDIAAAGTVETGNTVPAAGAMDDCVSVSDPAGLQSETLGDANTGNAGVGDDGGAGNQVDDGYRNTAEFLRARLRISAPEARRGVSDCLCRRAVVAG